MKGVKIRIQFFPNRTEYEAEVPGSPEEGVSSYLLTLRRMIYPATP